MPYKDHAIFAEKGMLNDSMNIGLGLGFVGKLQQIYCSFFNSLAKSYDINH
jgi:hypothetical protein